MRQFSFYRDNRNSDYFNELSFLIENSQFSERVKALGYQKVLKVGSKRLSFSSGSQSFESGLTLIEAMAFKTGCGYRRRVLPGRESSVLL